MVSIITSFLKKLIIFCFRFVKNLNFFLGSIMDNIFYTTTNNLCYTLPSLFLTNMNNNSIHKAPWSYRQIHHTIVFICKEQCLTWKLNNRNIKYCKNIYLIAYVVIILYHIIKYVCFEIMVNKLWKTMNNHFWRRDEEVGVWVW